MGRRAEALLDERDAALNSLAIPATDERRVRGLLFRSFIARAAKQLKEASELAQRTEDLARTGGFDSLRANALRSRGTSLRSLGQLDESVRIFDESVLLSDRIGDTQCFADALRGRGFALIELGQHQEAEDSLSDALALYREVSDNYGVASAQLSLARLASTAGQFERVQMHAKAGLNDARRLGNRGLLAGFFNQLGEAARGLEQFTEADRYYEQAIHIVRELQDPWRGIIEANRGLVLIELRSWEAAHEILRGAQRSLARTQAPVASAMVSTFLLPCLATLGHWEQFGTELSAAREGLERSGRTELDLARMPDKAAILATQAGKRVEAEGALSLARAQWVAQGSAAEVRRIDALLTAL